MVPSREAAAQLAMETPAEQVSPTVCSDGSPTECAMEEPTLTETVGSYPTLVRDQPSSNS